MAQLIRSNSTEEEKIKFYKENIAKLPQKEKFEFYLRADEFEKIYNEISAMISIKESDQVIVKNETMAFINKIVLLKLTGNNFLDIVRFIEKRLGRGSFKKLAEKFGKFENQEE